MMMSLKQDPCPCGLERPFAACCGPLIQGIRHAPTAEALMRSRYSAYVTLEVGYIEKTQDPVTSGDFDREGAETWARESQWLGLEIKAVKDGGEQDQKGTVEFLARYKANDQEVVHHEVSQFRKQGDQWLFVEGRVIRDPVVRSEPKIGRNDPCHCGSGQKFKKCHGK